MGIEGEAEPECVRPRLGALKPRYLSKNATIEMKITKVLTTGIAALAFAAPAATATLTATVAHADGTDEGYCTVAAGEGFWNDIGGCPEMARQGRQIASDVESCVRTPQGEVTYAASLANRSELARSHSR